VLAGVAQVFERDLIDSTRVTRPILVSYSPHAEGGRVVGFFVVVTFVTVAVESRAKHGATEGNGFGLGARNHVPTAKAPEGGVRADRRWALAPREGEVLGLVVKGYSTSRSPGA
jgi:hypothetical protein